jgi:hypothetical protein
MYKINNIYCNFYFVNLFENGNLSKWRNIWSRPFPYYTGCTCVYSINKREINLDYITID